MLAEARLGSTLRSLMQGSAGQRAASDCSRGFLSPLAGLESGKQMKQVLLLAAILGHDGD
jgi:hypothetical protein